jgi:hippurate hydrolase
VADRLQAWGYEVHRGLGGTGVVATLRAGSGTAAWACAPTWTRCR